MDRYAIIHSFHSQVYQTLADFEFDFIFSLDSHLDTQMGFTDHLDLIPEDVQLAALRASAHTLIRRALGELPILLEAEELPNNLHPDMILAIPQVSLDTDIFEKMSMVHESLKNTEANFYRFRKHKEFWLKYLKKFWGIKIYLSPPNNLLKFVKKINKADYALIDLDVDYIYELQNECYSPFKIAQPNQLGKIQKVISLIRKTKPTLITISEAKVKAMKNIKSKFSWFIKQLKILGYKIEYEQIFDDDKEAEQLLSIHKEYYEKIQKPLMKKHFADLFSDSFHNKLMEATRKYFIRS